MNKQKYRFVIIRILNVDKTFKFFKISPEIGDASPESSPGELIAWAEFVTAITRGAARELEKHKSTKARFLSKVEKI